MNHTKKNNRIRPDFQLHQKKQSKFMVILLFAMLLAMYSSAQNTTNVSINTVWPFNTGFTLAPASTPSTVPVGSADPNWQVSTSMSSGPQAIVINPPSQGGSPCNLAWSNNYTTGPWSQWITSPSATCSSVMGAVSCNSITDLYFSKTFTLPNNPIVKIWGLIDASDYVSEILVVNNFSTSTIWTCGSSTPSHRQSGLNFSWCTFKGGVNTIYIHVKQDPGWSSNTCKVMGLRVESWANFSTSAISGPTLACAGSTYAYSFPSPQSFGINPFITPTNYSWAPPFSQTPTWVTPGTNSVVAAVAGTNSGIMVASIYTVGAFNNKYCVATGGYSITVPPPLTLTPTSATSATVCTGKSLTITATPGAASYSYYAPSSLLYAGPSNTISITPSVGPATYTIKASNGCVYTKTLMVNTFQTPNVSVSSSSASICQGNCPSLTIGGTGWHYSLTPCGTLPICQVFTWNPLAICPTITTTYSIITISIQGCTNVASTNIVVNSVPSVTAVANPSVVCAGGGATCTLTASGASTYVWHNVPAPLAVNPKTVTPTGNICYNVTGAVGTCTANKIVCITTIAAPQITVTPPVICTGISNTLTATGGNNYTWTVAGSTPSTYVNTSTISITATAAVPFTVCGSGANGCFACNYGTVSLGSPIPITVPNVALCTNAGLCTTLTASSSLTVPVTYTWTSGTSPASGSSVIACPSVATVYTVAASSQFSGCPSSATMAVSIVSNCCAQPTTGLTQLGTSIGGPYLNNSYVLNNSTTLTTSAFFTNAEVWITEGVSITIPTGVQMQLEKTHLFGCGTKMWQGIIVQDGGRINTVNTRTVMSMIEDAVIAIQLDQISQTNASPNLPIDIARIMFNRNYIGIKISNSVPTLTVLPLGINGCLFTSRTLTYTTYPAALSWPNNDCQLTAGALRFPTSSTTDITPPYGYMAANFAPANLKIPYTFQPAHIGIKIENIGDPNSTGIPTFSNSGVEFGVSNPGSITGDFNLFEGIGHGIDVLDACLTTQRNVFQNLQYYYTGSAWFGGKGINHAITTGSQRFTRLDLRGGGNNFWDCNVGVNALNIYECWTTNSVFRSTQNVYSSAFAAPQTMQGDIGVNYDSESFDFTVEQSQFNNLRRGIVFRSQATSIGSSGIISYYNYFGPETKSTSPYSGGNLPNTTEYMDVAIDIVTPNMTWPAASWLIESNKINRAFRGINVDGFSNPSVNILANEILLEDDATYSQGQYGISVQNNLGNMAVTANTVGATGNWNAATNTTSAVYCRNNYGSRSPFIKCNNVSNTMFGFQFDSHNDSTVWQGNTMCNNRYGLGLTSNGIFGAQGSATLSNNNNWLNPATSNSVCGSWNSISAYRETYCENSSSVLSPLFVYNAPGSVPINNLSSPPSYEYKFTAPQSLFNASSRITDCPNVSSLAPPSWRLAHSQASSPAQTEFNEDNVKVYPNPTSAVLTISGINEAISVAIFDLSGKLVFTQEQLSGSNASVDLSLLAPSIYLMELKNGEGKVIRKKIVKTE